MQGGQDPPARIANLVLRALASPGAAEVKNWRGKILEVPSDHNTTRIFEGPREKNFQKKKMAGEDPLDPLIQLCGCVSFFVVAGKLILYKYLTVKIVSQKYRELSLKKK